MQQHCPWHCPWHCHPHAGTVLSKSSCRLSTLIFCSCMASKYIAGLLTVPNISDSMQMPWRYCHSAEQTRRAPCTPCKLLLWLRRVTPPPSSSSPNAALDRQQRVNGSGTTEDRTTANVPERLTRRPRYASLARACRGAERALLGLRDDANQIRTAFYMCDSVLLLHMSVANAEPSLSTSLLQTPTPASAGLSNICTQYFPDSSVPGSATSSARSFSTQPYAVRR